MEDKDVFTSQGEVSAKHISELKNVADAGLSTPEIQARIEEITAKRIAQIRHTKTTVEISGTSYYVSDCGDDNADGKSPENAWRTLERASAEELLPGDGVFFKRGDLFRGTLYTHPGVTYSAYGEGEKPKLYGWDKNSADPALWRETDEKNVWEYAEPCALDIGHVVFDDSKYARKVYPSKETDGRELDFRAKREFHDYHDLCEDFTFWHDSDENASGKLYLRCNAGNPGEIFSDIEMGKKIHCIINKGNSGVTIDNLLIAHTGSHGIGSGKSNGLTVTNCEIKWIGGSIQLGIGGFGGRTWPTPFGNGIEIYGEAKNFTVDNCYVWQCYDAGVTHQYSTRSPGNIDCQNIRYSNNVITDCVYNIEIFYGDYAGDELYTRHVAHQHIENNILRCAGGFGHEARPDEGVTALIRNGKITSNIEDYTVSNNVFDRSRENIVTATDEGASSAKFYDNLFVHKNGGRYAIRFGKQYTYDKNLAERIAETETESGSTYIYVDELGF